MWMNWWGVKVTALQNQIDELTALLEQDGIVTDTTSADDNDTTSSDNNDTTGSSDTTNKTVTVSGDSVNIRSSASTTASIVTTVSKGTVLTYLSQSSVSGAIWYNVKTSGGSAGWIRSDLCSSPK